LDSIYQEWSTQYKIRESEVTKRDGKEIIYKETLYGLSVAKGVDYIMSSDHFVAENVPPENYKYMLRRT